MYNPRLYRWLSPDPLAGDILNPQSLNRYAYVLNNPTNLIDPVGLDSPQGPPPHPPACNNTGCIWQYYGWTIPGYFGAEGVCVVDGVPTNCNRFFGPRTEPVVLFDPGEISAEGDIVRGPGVAIFAVGVGACAAVDPSRDSRLTLIEQLRDSLYASLILDPECMTFLGARGARVLDSLATLPISLGYARAGAGVNEAASTRVRYSEGQLAPTQADIVINRMGAFFGVSQRTQAALLLHELGHATGVLAPDASVPLSQRNTELVEKHCQTTLSNFAD
jgi:hypothetical protein